MNFQFSSGVGHSTPPLCDHPAVKHPISGEKRHHDGHSQRQQYPVQGERGKWPPSDRRNHGITQSFGRIGEWIQERDDLEPANVRKRTPGIVGSPVKSKGVKIRVNIKLMCSGLMMVPIKRPMTEPTNAVSTTMLISTRIRSVPTTNPSPRIQRPSGKMTELAIVPRKAPNSTFSRTTHQTGRGAKAGRRSRVHSQDRGPEAT